MLLRDALGETLRDARNRQNRTLRDVSTAANVSLGYLSEVERGRKEASSELLASICDALDLELSDLLDSVSRTMRTDLVPADKSGVITQLGEDRSRRIQPGTVGRHERHAHRSDTPDRRALRLHPAGCAGRLIRPVRPIRVGHGGRRPARMSALVRASAASADMAACALSIGTNRWSWWKPAITLQEMPSWVSAVANAAVKPTASSADVTLSVIHEHRKLPASPARSASSIGSTRVVPSASSTVATG